MKIRQLIAISVLAAAAPSCGYGAQPIVAGSVQPPQAELDRGRYLVRVAGCHDCHTPGYAQGGGQATQDVLLTGDATGFEGPWGTSFASNLRLTLLRFNDEQWLHQARTLTTRPPMPWFNLRTMNDEDLLAILRYVQWLGPKGEPSPPGLSPGEGYIGPMVRYTANEQ
ncbi:MAG: cytochrome C [Panacagrimonas sp.]